MSCPGVRIVRAGRERIPDLKPLFGALNEHQVGVAPTLADLEPRSADQAWQRRRAKYETWLSKPAAFLLIAEQDDEAVGYAVVSIGEGYDGWHSSDGIGDLHDFVVLPEMRGRGIGTILMDAVEDELRAAGVEHCRLRVIGRNVDAVRFYEQRGMEVVSHIMLGRLDNANAAEPGGTPPSPARDAMNDLSDRKSPAPRTGRLA
jgi:ribosomal protein S18 acetylase RimI-like enzyme